MVRKGTHSPFPTHYSPTLYVLSSGIAGTMTANGSGLQWATVRNIAMAWVLTVPAATVPSGALYWISAAIFA